MATWYRPSCNVMFKSIRMRTYVRLEMDRGNITYMLEGRENVRAWSNGRMPNLLISSWQFFFTSKTDLT